MLSGMRYNNLTFKMQAKASIKGYKNVIKCQHATSTFSNMEIPTNTYIHGGLIVAINGYTRRYEKVTRLQ